MSIKAFEVTLRIEHIEEGRVRVSVQDNDAHLISVDISCALTEDARKKGLRLVADHLNWLYNNEEY